MIPKFNFNYYNIDSYYLLMSNNLLITTTSTTNPQAQTQHHALRSKEFASNLEYSIKYRMLFNAHQDNVED